MPNSYYDPFQFCPYIVCSGNSDFDSSEQIVPFARLDNSNRECARILIIDDFLFEGDEEFLLRIQPFSNSQIMRGAVPEACVTILEDDSKLYLELETS